MKSWAIVILLSAGCAAHTKGATSSGESGPAADQASTPAAPTPTSEPPPPEPPSGEAEPAKPGSSGRAAKAPAEGARASRPAAHTVDGRPLTLVGQGVRMREGQKLYDMQMWIDDQDGRRAFPALAMRAGGRDHARLSRGDHAPAFLVWGRFSKQAIFRFARAVPAATMREEVKSALEDGKGADAVLALFEDAEAGDEWVLTTRDNGEIALRIGDEEKQGPQSPKLQRALWNVWLGARPVSVELRQKLIEHIDQLGR